MLQGNVKPSVGGVHGFDASAKLTQTTARALRNSGFVFGLRYLSRNASPPPNDLTAAEAQLMLDAGLAVMPVQHVAAAGWVPSESKGKTNGQNAASHANAIGFPSGINVWLDLEGVRHDAAAETVIAYCNAWFDVVSAAGYTPGIYVGASAILNGDQLYWRLRTKHYWKSGSKVPAIPERGYCMVQRIVAGDKVGGVEIDRNVTKVDGFGNSPIWLEP